MKKVIKQVSSDVRKKNSKSQLLIAHLISMQANTENRETIPDLRGHLLADKSLPRKALTAVFTAMVYIQYMKLLQLFDLQLQANLDVKIKCPLIKKKLTLIPEHRKQY